MPISKDILKKYGQGVFVSGKSIIEKPKMVIPICPALNIGLHGGIPEGSISIFSGKPKVGKTTTANHFAAKCQKPEYGNRVIFYGDIEARIKDMNLTCIEGLDTSPEKFIVIKSEEGRILNAEDHLNIAVDLITNNPGCVYIMDSASSLCAESEMIGEMKAATRNSGPKLLAQFCRKIAATVAINRCIVVIIQHLIANTSGYGSPFMEDGGNKIQYQSDIKLRAVGEADWRTVQGDPTTSIGQKVTWEVLWCGLGSPGRKVESYIRYGYGIDEMFELANMAKDFELVTVGGAGWITLPDGQKIQGTPAFCEYLKTHDEYRKSIETQIYGMMK